MFGNLGFPSSKSTEAGIRQEVGNTAKVILLDEFEASKDRDRIFEVLRSSTRGSTLAKGTADGKGQKYRLRHIAWVAAIESGMLRQPDINRFIHLELRRAKKGKEGHLTLPDGRELYLLGQKLLAIAVTRATAARRLALGLKKTKVEGVDARITESYAVPAAMLASATGCDEPGAEDLLRSLMEGLKTEDQGENDQQDLLGDILSSQVLINSKTGMRSIDQILEIPIGALYLTEGGQDALEARGIRLLDNHDLFIVHKIVRQGILRGSRWERQRIDTILLRLPGAGRQMQRVAGTPKRGILIPACETGLEPGPEENNGQDTGGVYTGF
jgi:hypothetical protein